MSSKQRNEAETTKRNNELINAANVGNVEAVNNLLRMGANPNAIDRIGLTPLFFAAVSGHTAIVNSLLDAGAEKDVAFVQKAGNKPIYIFKNPFGRIIISLDKPFHDSFKELPETSNIQGQTPLYAAAMFGNTEVVNSLVLANANKEIANVNRVTPLLVAVINGETAIVERLLAAGANKDVVYNQGKTPLHIAVSKGQMDIVDHLLAAGANKEAKDEFGRTPLHYVVSDLIARIKSDADRIAIIKRLITAGAKVNAANNNGHTALHIAAQELFFDKVNPIIPILKEAGADVNAVDKDGDTPLHKAVFILRNKANVEYLLSAGANVYIRNKRRETAKDIAYGLVHMDLEALIEKKSKDGIKLLNASKLGNVSEVNALLAEDVYIEATDTDLQTPLILAASEGRTEVVERLITAKANIEAANIYKQRPLFIAAKNGRTDVVERLIAAKANVDARDKDGCTPLCIAVQNGRTAAVERLLAAGADMSIYPFAGISAGQDLKGIAFSNRRMDIVRIIEAKEAEIAEARRRQKWKGFSRADISTLNSIFETEGNPPPAINTSCCPVCFKIVPFSGLVSQFELERKEACRYMTHNCSTSGGHYHEEIYNKYKNPEGNITWCTVCGRICTGHRHHKLAPANEPKADLLAAGPSPFDQVAELDAEGRPLIDPITQRIIMKVAPDADGACKADGGGGLLEKLARYRRMREVALELQDQIDRMPFVDAINRLIEETWNAPLRISSNMNAVLRGIQETKKWNIPLERFGEFGKPNAAPEAVPDVPWPFAGSPDMMPKIGLPEEGNVNTISYNVLSLTIQLKHRQAHGETLLHEKIGISTLFGNNAYGVFAAGNPDTLGKCFFQGCSGIVYPDELQYILQYIIDNHNTEEPLTAEQRAEYQTKINKYKERFNEWYRYNAAFKALVDADKAAAAVPMGGAGGQGGGRRRSRRRRMNRHNRTRTRTHRQ